MTVLRRLSLFGFVVVAPLVMTALLYGANRFLLTATHRVIDVRVLCYAAAVELPVFLLFVVLEAKNRW